MRRTATIPSARRIGSLWNPPVPEPLPGTRSQASSGNRRRRPVRLHGSAAAGLGRSFFKLPFPPAGYRQRHKRRREYRGRYESEHCGHPASVRDRTLCKQYDVAGTPSAPANIRLPGNRLQQAGESLRSNGYITRTVDTINTVDTIRTFTDTGHTHPSMVWTHYSSRPEVCLPATSALLPQRACRGSSGGLCGRQCLYQLYEQPHQRCVGNGGWHDRIRRQPSPTKC